MLEKKGRARIFGVGIDPLTRDDLLEIITSVDSNKQKIIAHVNIHGLNIAYSNRSYRKFLQQADAVFCDGFGVALGAKILGFPLESQFRSTCPDWIENLGALCEKKHLSLFLLAGEPGVSANAAEKLKKRFPNLKIDSHHGYFQQSGAENEQVLEQINNFSTDILYVGMGMPIQEFWIEKNKLLLKAKVLLPLGACLDFYTGLTARAPRWMTDHGLEWLGRLFINPRKLWKRYVIGNPLFFGRVLLEKIGIARFG